MESTSKTILVTGATGYVGGRLVPQLLDAGHTVRVVTRDRHRLQGRTWLNRVEIIEADAMDIETLLPAMQGVDAAYYMIHSMQKGGDFENRDRTMAHNFAQAAKDSDVSKLIYLGGLGSPDDSNLSSHLESRQEVGRILRGYNIDVIEFRAAIIVGSGSASFEMIRYLTERVPIMVTPRWVDTKIQPIAIRDILDYLEACLTLPAGQDYVIEVGGSDVLTYADMMKIYADMRHLKRYLIPVPVLTPRLSSYWVHIVTPITANIAQPLIDGLKNEVIVQNDGAERLFPDIYPMSYRQALGEALKQLDASQVETTWTDSLTGYDGAKEDESYAYTEKEGMMIEERTRTVNATPAEVFQAVTRIGGSRGWLYLNWLWVIRGIIDRFVGGPGYLERRHPEQVRVGDSLDFWRVVDLEEDRYMLLHALMKLPGKGWLEFKIDPDGDQTKLTQAAYYAPHGLWGLLYWYAIWVIHKFIFDGMIDALVYEAEAIGDPNKTPLSERRRTPIVLAAASAVLVAVIGIFAIFQRKSRD